MIRRINLFGGPGAGKSTTAAKLFSMLKERDYSIEHCTEYVKRWVYLKRQVAKHDQIYLLAKQQQMEYSCLQNGVKLIITDSPCFLSYFYSVKSSNDPSLTEGIRRIVESYEKDFPSLNLFIHRGSKAFDPNGRYQTEEEARQIDSDLLEYLKFTYTNLVEVDYYKPEETLKIILENIEK